MVTRGFTGRRQIPDPAVLLLSARGWNDILYRDELLDLEQRSNGFMLVLTLTREAAIREGDYDRRVDTTIMAEVAARLPAPAKHVLICGSNLFVNAAANGAVAAGIPVSIVRTERYGG